MECPHLCECIKVNRDFIKNKKFELTSSTTTTTTSTTTTSSAAAVAAATTTTTTTTVTTTLIDDRRDGGVINEHEDDEANVNNNNNNKIKINGVDGGADTTTAGKIWQCHVCSSKKQNWMCLNCGIVLCGRYENGHALQHAQEKLDHNVCLNTNDCSMFCYKCDDFVINDNNVNELRQELREDDAMSEASYPDADTQSVKLQTETASTSSSDSYWDEKQEQQLQPILRPPAPPPPPPTSFSSSTTSIPSQEKPQQQKQLQEQEKPRYSSNGRKLRPRKRTNSSDSSEGIKRKTLRKVVGLRNLGNTCFMNSVLQSLNNIQEFSYYFSSLPSLETKSANKKRIYHSRSIKENVNDAIVVEEIRKIFTILSQGGDGGKAISPECLFLVIWKVVPQFRGHRQHDAHEFLRYMLDRLHNELQLLNDNVTNTIINNGKTISVTGVPPEVTPASVAVAAAAAAAAAATTANSNNGNINNLLTPSPDSTSSILFKGRSSIVTNLFGGTLQSEVRCLYCGVESKKLDPFLDLSLDIPERFYRENDNDNENDSKVPVCHITDCLTSFTEVEELAETELYYCSSCKCKQKSTKRFWIRRLPNVLCLHIKRFRWNNFFRTKIDLRITFPIRSLDMSQFVLNNGPETRRSSAGNNVYDLAAVIVHHGNGSSCGHYTSFAINNGTWLHFNDHCVKEVSPSAVAECKPYILFYIRKDLNKHL